MSDYPKKIQETLEKISRQNSVPLDEVQEKYETLFSNQVLINQGIGEEERHSWAQVAIWSQFKAQPDNPEYGIIPFGVTSPNTTRSGKLQAELYGIVQLSTGGALRRIVAFDGNCKRLDEVALPTATQCFGYNPKLGTFKDGGDMIIDQKTVFENPEIIDHKILNLLVEQYNAVRVPKLIETILNPSRLITGSDGKQYADKTDLRIVTGIIVSQSTGTRDNGTEWGNYRVNDLSLGDDDFVTEDGNVQRRTLTVWLSPKLMVYPELSLCDFLGNIVLKKDEQSGSMEAQFNAILVIPKVDLRIIN